jgi:hypothetical protein
MQKRKVFLPLKLDDAELPLEMQRKYADFSEGYHRGFEELENFLASKELLRGHTPAHHLLVPVPFLSATDLDRPYCVALLQQLLPNDRAPLLPPIRSRQLQMPQFDEYAVMRREAMDRIATILEEGYGSYVNGSWANLRECIVWLEAVLTDGLALLMSNWRLKNSHLVWRETKDYAQEGDREEVISSIADAIWQFARIIRTQSTSFIHVAKTQDPLDSYFIKLFANKEPAIRGLFEPITKDIDFFGTPTDYLYVQVRQPDRRWSEPILFAGDDHETAVPQTMGSLDRLISWNRGPSVARRLAAARAMRSGESRLQWRDPAYLSTYLIPQLLRQHLLTGVPLAWDVDDLRVGHPDDNDGRVSMLRLHRTIAGAPQVRHSSWKLIRD